MNCSNCGVEISKEFIFAFSSNQCPACGKSIMNPDQSVAYLYLRELLKTALTEEDMEKISTLIMANFDLKKISIPGAFAPAYVAPTPDQDGPGTNTPSEPEKNMEPINVTEEVQESVITEDGVKLEVLDKKKTQDVLQRMRDEALAGAIDERYGVELEDEDVLLSEDPKANAELLKKRQKQIDARRTISSGSGGKNSFSRSS